jgi:DNA-binding transcriptional ArsR family regulator
LGVPGEYLMHDLLTIELK